MTPEENARAVGPAVAQFAAHMRRKLLENTHKGPWRELSSDYLMTLMADEMDELEEALEKGDPKAIIDECADVANFAMFIADNQELRELTPVADVLGDRDGHIETEELHVAKCDIGDCEWESDPNIYLSHAQDELTAHQYGHKEKRHVRNTM